jgi:predicted alpha-1,2-mannosidase
MSLRGSREHALLGLVLLFGGLSCSGQQSKGDFAAWVNPFIGTDAVPIDNGTTDAGATFPGAVVPFGMIQWSPDTKVWSGGGYSYQSSEITGFSLTHMSGVGCGAYQDFGILPTVGLITDPATAVAPFSHSSEQPSPGWYALTLGTESQNAIRAELTVTERTGLGQFRFPRTQRANFLFKTGYSHMPRKEDASVRIAGNNEVEGWIREGGFCSKFGTAHTLYFVARFDHSFTSYGTWKKAELAPNTDHASGLQTGLWLTFDTTQNPAVKLKMGISYVSASGARANLEAENPGWSLEKVHAAARRAWNEELGRIQIDGGTDSQRRTFYTALYHSLLFPSLFSDVDGSYLGFDSQVHQVEKGRDAYANFSDWDIYRSQIPLLAWLDSQRTSDMMQSLVEAATQEYGILPHWPAANSASRIMGGDSADPVIAGAYAFGAHHFDAHSALAAMVKGASDASARFDGWYSARPRLTDDLHYGYLPLDRSVDSHAAASETLEYALDDFSIAEFAHALGNEEVYREFLKRSENWKNLFDPASHSILPRDAAGAFQATTNEDGWQQYGFEEGNSAQYTWMVPFDLGRLVEKIGGRGQAAARLDKLFEKLNAGASQPYAWMGNEPGAGLPWIYLSLGEPWKTQELTHRILSTLFNDTSGGLPGNDDMGQMSAWYVWTAMGIYPDNPAVRILDIGSPLFPHIVVHPKHGPQLIIDAPGASSSIPYVESLTINGLTTDRPWLELPSTGSVLLAFHLAAEPNKGWGSTPGSAPPSYAPSRGPEEVDRPH